MNRTFIVLSIVSVLVVGTAGYIGFASNQPATPTVQAPQTVAVAKCDVQQTVSAPGSLVNTSETYVKMPTSGRLAAVLVKIGDTVKAGQKLAELDDVAKTEAKSKLLEAQQNLTTAQGARTSMDYPRATDAYLEKLRKDIKLARENVALMADLYKHTEDPDLKSQALANLATAQSSLDDLTTKYNWYVGKPGKNDIAAADTALELAQAQYDAAQAVMNSLEIKAPFDGVVLEVQAQIGETFAADANLFKVADPLALQVKANVTQEDYPLLVPGQAAELYFDARSDISAQGRIESIIPKRIEGGDHPLYNIYISLDEVPDGLADGMTSDAAITIAEHKGVLCLPRAVVHASGGDKLALKVWDGAQTQSRQVTVGLRGDAYIEILSGLKEGERVVTK